MFLQNKDECFKQNEWINSVYDTHFEVWLKNANTCWINKQTNKQANKQTNKTQDISMSVLK